MKIRKITSLTALLSFVFMVVSSIVLFVVPQGRVAYWADWRLWGLSKEQWGELHINLGLLFLVALAVHIYYNWKPVTAYLKDRAKQLKVLTPEFNAALVLVILFSVGTLLGLPPFSGVQALNDAFKTAGAEKYGEPPYGHAELSTLQALAKNTGINVPDALQRLRDSGFTGIAPDRSLAELAAENQTTPQRLYEAMKPPAAANAPMAMPDMPPPGTGSLTLVDLCRRYGLDMGAVAAGLDERNIAAAEGQTLKEIAAAAGMGPAEVYEAVRAVWSLKEKVSTPWN
ncbi:MAG: DUF4405 domain-containing protein [Desulfobacteraceae bacterium]|nr:DUF4405 domain-containing protein [Desulfobacteraceae bacterium]